MRITDIVNGEKHELDKSRSIRQAHVNHYLAARRRRIAVTAASAELDDCDSCAVAWSQSASPDDLSWSQQMLAGTLLLRLLWTQLWSGWSSLRQLKLALSVTLDTVTKT